MQIEISDKLDLLLSAVKKKHAKEASLETALVNLCEELQLSPEQQWETGDGPVDIYLHGHRTLIECKPTGKIVKSQLRTGGSQFEQVRRYVVSIRRLEASYLKLENARRLEWTVVLTDGQQWLMWRWQDAPGAIEPLSSEPVQLDVRSDPASIVEFLRSLGSDGSKPLAPSNPHILYANDATQLQTIWEQARELRGAQIQFNLWWDAIRASGMDYGNESEAQTMFVRHCALVSFARAVRSALIDPDARDPIERERLQTEGFINWICQVQEGYAWLMNVQDKTDMFDWRKRKGDILQVLYQEIVPKDQRKVYGEYYTPDWLAEMLAEELLDEEWCCHAIQASLRFSRAKDSELVRPWGVLDPTCGSGTFLYHAVRRIVNLSNLREMELTREEQADVVARLVFGIDIHPVAVEFAQTTLLRSLPAPPTLGDSALNVWQGDSLLAEWGQGMQEMDFMRVRPGQESFTFRSPKSGRSFTLPRSFVTRGDFARDMKRFTDLANAQKSFPSDLFTDQASVDYELLERSFGELKDICHFDENGIWAYHVNNWISPTLLAERKVNRILANPPWITLNTVQNPHRKTTFKDLAERLDLWVGGRRASSFDVACTFVLQCSKMYLSEDSSRAGWVLNAASLRAGTWEKFRERLRDEYSLISSLELLTRKPPFITAASSVWYIGLEQKNELLSMSTESARIKPNDPWYVVRDRVIRIAQSTQGYDTVESEYIEDKTGQSVFRQGACFRPHVLVRVDPTTLQVDHIGTARGRTVFSKQSHWKNYPPIAFEVPAAWVHSVVRSYDLVPYSVRPVVSKVIVPLDFAQQKMLNDKSTMQVPFWRNVNSKWEDSPSNKGHGTPRTLIENLNHYNKVTSQIRSDSDCSRVVYNESGKILRAARVPNNLLVDESCFYFDAASEEEAQYLVGILNAESLKDRFSATRETDRHFHAQFWKKVPIPRFSRENSRHLDLIGLVKQAEARALSIASTYEDRNQVRLSKYVRENLSTTLKQAINKIAIAIVTGEQS